VIVVIHMKPLKKINRFAFVATTALGSQLVGLPLHAALSEEQEQALINRVNQLEQQVKVLQRNREVEKEISDEKSKTATTVSLGVSGLVVKSGDTNFVMNLHGYAQTDARFYEGQKSAADTFLVRRVRPILEGTVYEKYNYRLMLDIPSGSVTGSTTNNVNLLDDAYVNVKLWNEAQIQIGKYKSPVGLERLKSTSELAFVETGFATQLTPNYDLGVMVHNDLFNSRIGYGAGIFTGAADGKSQDFDADSGKDYVGRLFFQPFLQTSNDYLKHIGFGAGGSIGSHTGGPAPSYTTPGQQTIYSYSTNLAAAGILYRIDPQAFYYVGPFGINAEYILSSQEYATKGLAASVPKRQRLNNQAWQVEGSWFVTGEENSFKGSGQQRVVPLRRFGLGADSGWGAFELVGRVQQLTLDNKSFDYAGFTGSGSVHQATSWGVGINWYLNPSLKFNLNYESTTFNQRSAVSGTASYKPEHVILTRAQLSF
jgi:phosphate-selective porin OprO/OprP